ncbi:MAG: hypothetical protein OEW93_02965 [Candidatus Bathyarchaeota archaeon]|nr:hypothetical protein [Candidatus Bathyarchaeota archaeon]
MALIIAGRMLALVALLIIVAAILFYMQRAFSGKIPNLRRLPAVDVIAEILGRCVEMGRPAWYLFGSTSMTTPSILAPTVAAFQTLAYTARMAARVGAKFFVPVNQGLAYTMAYDIVNEAYRAEGKLEDFDPLRTVMYLPAGADRMYIINHMWEEQVAGAFFLGSWYHEAVIYTENAARVGALMLGGTDTTHNIPFMVAICDYSIIGEELYALGAYISQDPTQSSSLAGQDIGKYFTIILILIGAVLATAGISISWLFKM